MSSHGGVRSTRGAHLIFIVLVVAIVEGSQAKVGKGTRGII